MSVYGEMNATSTRTVYLEIAYLYTCTCNTNAPIFFFFYVCVEANIVVHAIILPCFFLRQLTHTKLECDFPIHNTKPTYPYTKWDTRNKNQFLKKKGGGVKKKRTWNQIKIMTHCKISFKCLNHSRFLLGTFMY